MNYSRWRLGIASVLFLGWLGYMGFLVLTRPTTGAGWPLVLSRPQIMTSEIDIIADVGERPDTITVREVLWPPTTTLVPGAEIEVERLGDCRPLQRRPGETPPLDVSGPGSYLIPLRRLPGGKYEVAPIPSSPGFHPGDAVVRVYPATKQALAQYGQIEKSN